MSLSRNIAAQIASAGKATLFRFPTRSKEACLVGIRIRRRFTRVLLKVVFASGRGVVTVSGNTLSASGEIELATENLSRLLN